MIDLKDFEKVDIRVGTILESTFNDKLNKPSIILIIDFGSKIGLKKTSAQLTKNYNPDELISKCKGFRFWLWSRASSSRYIYKEKIFNRSI